MKPIPQTITAQEACRLITAYAAIDDPNDRINVLRAVELYIAAHASSDG